MTRSLYGGSCYLNNSAVAAAELLAALGGPVAIVDIDAHHGNGTQELFRGRDDVRTASVHVDPGAGWFPHFLGFADENDESNLQPAGRARLRRRAVARGGARGGRVRAGARALVVALGVDAATADPESPLAVTARRLRRGGPHPRRARAADGRRAGGRLRPRRRSATSWSRRSRGSTGVRHSVSDTVCGL